MPEIERPVEQTEAGQVTLPVPGDVVQIEFQADDTCHRGRKGQKLYLIVLLTNHEPGKHCEITVQSHRRPQDCERYSMGTSGKWWTSFPQIECTLKICHHVRVLNVPRGDPIEVIVEE